MNHQKVSMKEAPGFPKPLDVEKVRVFPLAERRSLTRLEDILIPAGAVAPSLSPEGQRSVDNCASAIATARDRGASVILMYGAHLVKNGLMAVVNDLVSRGCLTHLATNGAGTIHDWEFAFQGRSEESVRENVAIGRFGTWQETGANIMTALLAGGLRDEGYGRSLGRFIAEDGTTLPAQADLEQALRSSPADPLSPARADLLSTMVKQNLSPGAVSVAHPFKASSILGHAFKNDVPMTVHPGIGYDIIATHPMYCGAAVGRAAARDFALFGRAVENLDHGVVLVVGSAIMAPQVFEKSLSVVNNLRMQQGRGIVANHSIFVVDIQDGGGWDWAQGEPPKSNPAYYLRFCKSFARMGGNMEYIQMDNRHFLQGLSVALK